VRKLAKTLGTLFLLVPSAALALGLGNIQLHSALNEPLNAEIGLLSVDRDEVGRIEAALASLEDFARAGVDRPAVLMFLQFDVVRSADGRPYVQVTSSEPIREPFLNFILEVEWPSGRLLREYTVLLDPPEMLEERAPVTTPPEAARTAAPRTAAPRTSTPSATATKPLRYGPVTADDTLWSIAKNMRPSDDISVQQTMMALLRSNPDAFTGGNINRLKRGYVLRIDDPAMLTAMSRAEAARAVARQTRAWEARKQQLAEAAPARDEPAVEGAPPPRETAAPEASRLKLVTPDTGEETAAAGSGDAETETEATEAKLQRELMLAQEAVEAQRQENTELSQRLSELEGQLAAMQRLLELQDPDLATVQQQLAGEEEQPSADGTGSVASAEEEAAAADKAEERQPEESTTPPETAVAGEPEQGVIERITALAKANLMLVGGGLLLLLLLALLVATIVRRQRGTAFSESILAGGSASTLGGKSAEGGASQDTSLFSDLAISGMDGVTEESEVDPLTEADVYMAYGRYQQAEELLQKAIEEEPSRPELQAKLLELYHQTKNRSAFETAVQKFHELTGGSGPHWEKVLVLGHELLPDNPLFTEAPEEAPPAEERSAPATDEVLDIGLDLDALAEDMESTAGEEGGTADLDLDLGVDFSDLGEPEKKQDDLPGDADKSATPEETPTGTEMDFRFDDLDLDEGGTPAPEEAEPRKELPEEEGAPGDAAAAEEGAAPKEEESLEAGLEFDLGDFKLDTEEEQPESMEPEVDEMSLDFDLGEPAGEEMAEETTKEEGGGEEPAALEMEATESETDEDLFGDLDELGTKLDLARAYIDMGDADGARNILDEVLQEGNDEQQQEARKLMEQIG